MIATRLCTIGLATLSLARWASAGLIHDQGDVNEGSKLLDSITTQVIANDFTLGSTTTLETFRLWVVVQGYSGETLAEFGGTIGWGIYSDAIGEPDQLLASGQDVNVQVTSTSQVLHEHTRVFQLDGVFESPTFGSVSDLAPGNYWLAIHEGDWLSPDDGSSIAWVWASNIHGSSSRVSGDPTSPDFSIGKKSLNDHAFQLYGTASASSVPEPSALVLSALGALGLIGVRRRRSAEMRLPSTNRSTSPA